MMLEKSVMFSVGNTFIYQGKIQPQMQSNQQKYSLITIQLIGKTEGPYILIQNNIIATEQPQYVTKCELDWVKITLKDSKDLLIGAFYMPHRNNKDMEELEKSLKIITEENNNNNIIIARDFNCPDI
jgi:hypothetical protein